MSSFESVQNVTSLTGVPFPGNGNYATLTSTVSMITLLSIEIENLRENTIIGIYNYDPNPS